MLQNSRLPIRRVGLSMFVIDTPGGTRFLTDPWFRGNPTLIPEFGADEFLATVDALLVSHGHTDHAEGIPRVRGASPGVDIFTGFELGMLLLTRHLPNITYMNFGGSVSYRDTTVHFVPASHESAYRVIDPTEDRSSATSLYAGLAGGILLTLQHGYRIYYAGDTGLSAEMTIIRDYWKPDLVILPVGGSTLGMDPDQAAYAAGVLLRARHVIPCHWFPPPDEAPDPQLMTRSMASSGIRGATGHRGREFAAMMRERHPEVTVTLLELGDGATIDTGGLPGADSADPILDTGLGLS